MFNIIMLLLTALVSSTYAAEVEIKINPKKPVVNEVFQAEFNIKTDTDEIPMISFTPVNIEVISRSTPSISTRATYINGKVSVEKNVSITYELRGKTVGNAYLSSIKVQVGKKSLSLRSRQIKIVKTTPKAKNIFVQAEVNKDEVYVGESILVRYYLYSRADVPIRTTDIKKFPKLSQFLKRYHQESTGGERISLNGQMYIRRVMYTAQLYAQNPGKYTIDSISMRVGYSVGGNTFGNFGFNLQLGRQRTSTLISPEVEINVLSLPGKNIPKNFTGLVGTHDFKLTFSKERFIVNEPIELQLTVIGNGALELFEAPSLFNTKEIEEFEKTGDLVINKNFTAQKKINYTYLGRENYTAPARSIPLSYFDPDKKQYKTVKLAIPALKIAGAGTANVGSRGAERERLRTNKKESTRVEGDKDIDIIPESGWNHIYSSINTYIYHVRTIVSLFLALLLLLAVYIIVKILKNSKPTSLSPFQLIYRRGVDYGLLHKAIDQAGDGRSMSEIITKLDLDKDAETYFVNLIQDLEKEYSENGNHKVIKPKKKYFKILEQKINDHI